MKPCHIDLDTKSKYSGRNVGVSDEYRKYGVQSVSGDSIRLSR